MIEEVLSILRSTNILLFQYGSNFGVIVHIQLYNLHQVPL